MNTPKVIHQAKLNDQANTIREQQASSLSVAQWCNQHQLSKTQFYYWNRQLKGEFVKSSFPDIVPLTSPVPNSYCTSCITDTSVSALSTLKLTIGDISLGITEDTSDFLLAKVIKAVRNA